MKNVSWVDNDTRQQIMTRLYLANMMEVLSSLGGVGNKIKLSQHWVREGFFGHKSGNVIE